MKKWIVLLLAASLLVLPACKARPSGGEASQQETQTSSQEAEREQDSSSEEEREEEPSTESESSEEEEPEETVSLSFEEQVALNYGAQVVRSPHGTSQIKVSDVSLFFIDDWTNAMDVEAGAYYSWYLSMVWKDDLSYEEQREKYKSPRQEDEGWFFPQDIYESAVQQYFDVTTEHLRSERLIYNEELEGYYLGTGGGIGEGIIVTVLDMEEQGELRKIRVRLRPESSVEDTGEHKVLTIKMSGDSYKFVSYVTE